MVAITMVTVFSFLITETHGGSSSLLVTSLTRRGMMAKNSPNMLQLIFFYKEPLTCIKTPLRLGSKTCKIGGLIVNEQ